MPSHQPQLCLICKGPSMPYMRGQDFLYKTNTSTYTIHKCTVCGSQQLCPIPDTKTINTFYPASYYSYHPTAKNSRKNLFQKIREKIVDIHHNPRSSKNVYFILAKLLQHFPLGIPLQHTKNNSFLDIGCGDGSTIRLLRAYGWKCRGYEMGKKSEKEGIFYDANIINTQFDIATFDHIRIWHVLEHVPNPHEFIQKVYTLLSPNGTVTIAIPNTASIYASMFGTYWYNRDIPRHIVNYNPKSLRILLESNGLSIDSLSNDAFGGFLGSMQHLINNLFQSHINLMETVWLAVACSLFDALCATIRKGDIIYITATKKVKI